MIVVLCGGVGGSRFLRGLASVVEPERLTAVVNTGDDDEFHGLYVSPDPDIVTYALAGEVDEERGWGFRDETFRWLDHIRTLGHETWFQIGDRDLATHLHRTRLLHEGARLSDAAAAIASAFGVTSRILPMSNERVRTIVATEAGELTFQRYLVERHARDRVLGVRYEGATEARPAPGVLDAIEAAEAIFIAPSNPVGSIGPILAVRGIREALVTSTRPRVAVSPIVGGRSLQPPAGEMMSGLGYPVSVAGVGTVYARLVDTLIIDHADVPLAAGVEALGMRCLVAATVMWDSQARRDLGLAALRAAGISPATKP